MRRDLIMQANDATAFRPFSTKAAGSRIGFRFADGRMKSLPYMHLAETEFNPDVGIILTFIGHRVTLTGRNLSQLYYEIEAEEIGEIIEQHARDLTLTEADCFVRQISWECV